MSYPKVVIVIEGGLIQNIISTEPMDVIKLDMDVDGADEDELATIPNLYSKPTQCFASVFTVEEEYVDVDQPRVDTMHRAILVDYASRHPKELTDKLRRTELEEGMVKYTNADMMKLAQMSPDTSVAAVFLEDMSYNPKKFLAFLKEHHLEKDIEFLFRMPFEDLPLEVNNASWMGYISFRLSIGK